MEPQETIYCYENSRKEKCEKCSKKRCFCLGTIAIILLIAFSFVIGLIVGATLFFAILGSLASVIVLAVILGILLILSLILIICSRNRKKKRCKYKCCS